MSITQEFGTLSLRLALLVPVIGFVAFLVGLILFGISSIAALDMYSSPHLDGYTKYFEAIFVLGITASVAGLCIGAVAVRQTRGKNRTAIEGVVGNVLVIGFLAWALGSNVPGRLTRCGEFSTCSGFFSG